MGQKNLSIPLKEIVKLWESIHDKLKQKFVFKKKRKIWKENTFQKVVENHLQVTKVFIIIIILGYI